jgi:regulator of replication initiation timing
MSFETVDLKTSLQDISLNIETADIASLRRDIHRLLNLIESIASENVLLRAENQELKNEISRLKGEQGTPIFRPQTKLGDISSEAERQKIRNKNKARRKSKAKKHKIKINRTVKLGIAKSKLPPDAHFKGYDSVVVQDLVIKTDNVMFKKEVFYSRSERQTYRAELPLGYHGEFGPGVRSLVISLAANSAMTQPAIVSFLNTHGTYISAATVGRILSSGLDPTFHAEKADIIRAGMASADYANIDDTSARVMGKNHYTHVLCNPYFTAYVTLPRKDRMTIIEILSQSKELTFKFGELAFSLMAQIGLPQKHLESLLKSHTNVILSRQELDSLLAQMFQDPKKDQKSRQTVMEASAICAYQDSPEAVSTLICDDAPQFKLITKLLGLCWIHEGRHYKKLTPFLPVHLEMLTQFLDDFWAFYEMLLYYKDWPSAETQGLLSAIFDALFGKQTGYDQLDKRIAITRAKREELLLVLKHPEIPLHNNSAELGARAKARSRDISLQTRSLEGTQAKDTLMTIVQTCRKLGVNVFDYIYDRVSEAFVMPSLASLMPSDAQCQNTS